MVKAVYLIVVAAVVVSAYKNPHFRGTRSVIVHLFEWKWTDIANECERFLGPKGFGGVQISPPNENVEIWSYKRPWWERYQPMSYKLTTRSGTERQFAEMVRRCNRAGVRIYVDAVINHMTSEPSENCGTAGSTAVYSKWLYRGVPYTRDDFNLPHCTINRSDYATNAERVRNCELLGLKDLNHTRETVRDKIVAYMNRLIDYGVAGFRIDSAKYIWPNELAMIYTRLKSLRVNFNFPWHARPYIYQEVIDYGGEAISRDEYTPLGAVTEFRAGMELSNCFRGFKNLKWLKKWGPSWRLLNSRDALTFIDNHDNERGHNGGLGVLTYKEPRKYKAAIAFLLAHPYGQPRIMSSYEFWNTEVGPPMDFEGNIISPTINSDETCGNGWVCQHRWRQIYAMVDLRNYAGSAPLNSWWDNGGNQIAFCRGRKVFIAFNNEIWDMNQYLYTCLPPGKYCDVISGVLIDHEVCKGKIVEVDDHARAHIRIKANDHDIVMAIHTGPASHIRADSRDWW